MKIGISGAHSTGKTTFIRRLEKQLSEKSIKYKTIADLATICPLPILRNHTVESTLWIAAKGITEEVEAVHNFPVVIADRSILDCWAYFEAVCKDRYKEEDAKFSTLKNLVSNWLPTYDCLYLTVIDEGIKIENTKGRDLDPVYRKQIDEEMRNACLLFEITPQELSYKNADRELHNIMDLIISKL